MFRDINGCRICKVDSYPPLIFQILADCSRKRISPCDSGTLEEGYVYEWGNGHLLPVCSNDKHPEIVSQLRFAFQTTVDKEIVFSPLK